MNVGGRLSRLQVAIGAQYLLCLRYEDIRWLSGFTGSTSQLLVDIPNGSARIFVDGRYVDRAQSEIDGSHASVEVIRVESGTTVEEAIAAIVGSERVSVDPHHVTAAQMATLETHCAVVKEMSPLDQARRVKDAQEILLIEHAVAIADIALCELLSNGIEGSTEREVRNQLDHLMRQGGADDVAFHTIVASGPNGARPHHEPSDCVIEAGHLVVIDFGAEVEGYRSDMTRTIRVGSISQELNTMFEIVRQAQSAGVAAVRAGVVGSEIDAAVRAVFAKEGVEHEYVHGTGHGIGLFIHEQPIFSPRCSAVLSSNEVVTVEPGLYRKGVGGVRIEDLVVVGDNSCRNLTNTPKDLSCPRSPQTI